MKKRVLSIVLALIIVFTVVSVAATTVFAEDTHTHTFSNEWTINTTGHWHECTAEGCNIKDYSTCGLEGVAYSKHTGLTDDNTCDICGKTFYRPYDVTYTDSTINFKVNVLDRNSEPYTKADCMRFDVFLRANNSGTSYDANMDFDHNGYYNGTEFAIYESPSAAGYCVKDGATYTVVLNASSVNQITDFDENNPFVWIILRPGMYNNCMDYGGGYSLNMTYANFYNCSVCLGKFGSLKDFQDVKPEIPSTLTLGDFDASSKTFSKAEGTGTDKFRCVAIYIANTVSANDTVTLPAGYTKSAKSDDYKIYVNLSEAATADEIAKDFISKVAFDFEAENSVRFELLPNEPSEAYFYNEDTQHYYTFVDASNCTWTDAYEAARNMQYNGRQGYLATVTSKAEDTFIFEASGNKIGWLGSSRLKPSDKEGNYYNSFSTTETTNNWCWSCGPEIGTEFFDEVKVPDGRIREYDEQRLAEFARNANKGYYFNWDAGEPSNGSGTENAMTTLMSGAGYSTGSETANYSWNDVPYNLAGLPYGYHPKGYMVEFGDLTVGDSNTAVNPSDDGLVTIPKIDRILSVTEQTTPVVGQYVTLEVLVSKPAAKIQFVNSSKGTVTYHEGSDRVYSITENADGTQTWVIKLMVYKLSEPYTVLPKFGKVWTAEGSYDYTLNDNHKYEGAVYSVTVPDATDNKATVGRHDVIIETNLDVAKVQFAYLGTTATFSPNSAVSVEEKDGHLFWTCNFNFCKKGTAMNFDINTRTKVTSFEYSGVSLVIDVTK